MKQLKTYSILFLIISLLMTIPSVPALSESIETKNIIGDAEGPIVIRSNMFEVDNREYTVTFTGDVDVERDDLTISCDKILLFYERLPTNEGPEGIETKINKIIAEGTVKISRPTGGLASAEKAVFYNDDERLVLTGKPIIKQGDDFVEGAKITLFLKENRSIVEGSDDDRAKAVLYPKKR